MGKWWKREGEEGRGFVPWLTSRSHTLLDLRRLPQTVLTLSFPVIVSDRGKDVRGKKTWKSKRG